MQEPLIDLHCHVLPGVDDGPADTPAALDLVLGLERLGFGELHPTPHQKAGSFQPSPEVTATAAAELRGALHQAGSQVTIHPPGGENMWDEVFLARREGTFPTYPGGRAFLLEFPPGGLPPLGDALFQLRLGGRLPVLAHVERYPRTFKDRSRIEALGQLAALLVNLVALGGGDGGSIKRLARALVKGGLIHAVSSDAHGAADLPDIAAGLRWLRSNLGDETAQRLLCDGPRRIMTGELPAW